MRDDPILALENELVAAARRAAAPRRRVGAGIAVSVAAATIAVVVAASALLLLGGRTRPVHSTAATPPAHGQLVDILAVLRRPQTKGDLTLPSAAKVGWLALAGTPDRALIRFAGVTPWQTRVFVVPIIPLSGRQLDRIHQPLRGFLRLRAARGEVITVLAGVPQPVAGFTAADIEAGRATLVQRGGGRHGALRVVTLVPDGVANVALALVGRAGEPENLIESVDAHDNVAALEVYSRPTRRMALVWFARDGHVIRRVPLL